MSKLCPELLECRDGWLCQKQRGLRGAVSTIGNVLPSILLDASVLFARRGEEDVFMKTHLGWVGCDWAAARLWLGFGRAVGLSVATTLPSVFWMQTHHENMAWLGWL